MRALINLVLVIMLADFVTGFIHWLEDSYWTEKTPVLGKWLVKPNLEHHRDGQAFLKKSWLASSWDLMLIGLFVLYFALTLHHFTWEVCLFALITMNANQIHKWAHMTDRNPAKPKVIGWLQRVYVLQSPMHHGQHHRKPNNSHYCTVTNWLNPILDAIGFWRGLEFMFGTPQVRA